MSETFTPDFSAPFVIGATGMDAVRQNIRVIIQTFRFSIPLDRAFAHEARPLDSPGPRKTAMLTARLIEAIEKYEPRVKVESLDWLTTARDAMEGVFLPRVVFRLKEGVKL